MYGESRFMLSPVYASMAKACTGPMVARECKKGAARLSDKLVESPKLIEFACVYLPAVETPTLAAQAKA